MSHSGGDSAAIDRVLLFPYLMGSRSPPAALRRQLCVKLNKFEQNHSFRFSSFYMIIDLKVATEVLEISVLKKKKHYDKLNLWWN